MRNPKETALHLHGRALRDFADGDPSTTIVVHSDLGEHDEMPISFFFRDPANFLPGEQEMLNLCTGTVLDLGAGTGVDTLALQERGLTVTAVEVVPAAVEIMRERGVQNPVCADMFEFETEPVDTILMIMNGNRSRRYVEGPRSLPRTHVEISPVRRPDAGGLGGGATSGRNCRLASRRVPTARWGLSG